MGLSALSGLSGLSGMYGGVSPLLTSLVSHWSVEAASGTRADDYGGNTLTDNNTVTQAAGKVGNAGQFTAANSEYLSIADNAALSMGDIDFTVGTWVYLDSKGGDRGILGKYAVANAEYLLLYNSTPDRFTFIVRNTADSAQLAVSANIFGSPPLATWCFVVCWHDSVNDLIGISVNAGTPTTLVATGGCRNGTAAFELGRYSASAYHNGRIDQAFVTKRVLTAAERTWLYNAGAGRSWADILAYRG